MFYENIYDLLNEVGEFIKIDDIEKQINLLPFTLYEGIKNSILRSWPDIRYMNTIADQVLQTYQSTVNFDSG